MTDERDNLRALMRRLLDSEPAQAALATHASEAEGAGISETEGAERALATVLGNAAARVLFATATREAAPGPHDLLALLDEAAQVRAHVRELEAANADLKTKDQIREEVVASVAHELRTPLTAIRAFAELVLDTPDIGEDQRDDFLRIIISESDRLTRMVNQILDLAKLESGHTDWHTEEVDLIQMVTDAVKISGELFRARGARVVTHLPETVPPVRADPDRITQVLMNLLSNAAKFVRAEGGQADVTLRRDGDSLIVEVKDNGAGVPEADQSTIFEKFRQSGDSRSRPQGTGLGLPISREIVNHFGGNMWLVSQPGSGATFAFRLPLQPEGGNTP